jgi:LysR family glycine cleavage system transcriptional activator
MKRLPPLRLLVTFEAVARLGTMRDAANALNVTQPAITQSLKALEDFIGVTLLDRDRKPARLNSHGQMLASATHDGLETIARAIEEIQADASDQAQFLTVSCTLGMATYWLMPRLPGFYAEYPDILVNVHAHPSDEPTLSAGIDLALRYGTGGWPEKDTVKLFDEVVCAVGQPALIKRLHAEGNGLDRAPLIHVRAPENAFWEGWPDYFKKCGLVHPIQPGQNFDNYVQAVQAAVDGRGLMLGWRSITATLVAEGTLAQWFDDAIDVGTGYYATLSPRGRHKVSAQAFMHWLTSESA